ncbi:MAG: 2-dehydropantoate 2-reductase [bacterium]|nr:2-dehydropantoate 2-reductase [bacterium]
MTKKRTAIIGIGGIGGFLAVKLISRYKTDDDHEFVLIQRGEHLKEIRKSGLKYISNGNECVVVPDLITDDYAEAGRMDIVIICTKSYDLENVARSIRGNLDKDSIILSTLNGVDSYERLSNILPDHQILDGCIYVSAKIDKPGIVRRVGGMGNYFFGPVDGNAESFRWLEQFLQEANIMAELIPDIKIKIWKKYLFTSALSSVTSLYGKNLGYVLGNAESRKLLMGLIDEIISLAEAMGVNLPAYMPDWILTRIEIMNPEIKTSMQLDIERGKNTEIGIFTEFVVKKGHELNVPVPLHDEVYPELAKKLG